MSGYVQPGAPWLVASNKEGRPISLDGPYPCRCEDVDYDLPQWKRERALRSGRKIVYVCDPYLHKTTSTWRNRCMCWGRVRDDHLPDGCCANHEHSPRYSVRIDGVLLDPTVEPPPVEGAVAPAEVVDVELPPEDPAEELGQRFADETGDFAVIRMPYVPHWSAAERTCECTTPWDGVKKGYGYHCVACHVNWTNVGVAGLHQRSILDPCKPPVSIVDCELGTPILRMRTEGRHVVWG
jgi:hypothetical protein